jgi:hypothetical protein
MPTGPESAPIDPELLDASTEPELLPDPEVLPDPEPLADPELLLEPELLAPELELLIEAECIEPASSGDVLELPEVTLVPEEDPSLPPASAEPAELELQARKTVVARIGQKPRGRTSKARFGESTQSTNTLRVPVHLVSSKLDNLKRALTSTTRAPEFEALPVHDRRSGVIPPMSRGGQTL